MKQLPFLLVLLLVTSCQLFETEKITSETIYEEEMKTIDWKCVDQYPAFQVCETNTEKEAQRACFISALSTHMNAAISSKNMKATQDVQDTVHLDFSVGKDAKLTVSQVVMDSTLRDVFPLLEEWLLASITEVRLVAPAYKRGIPVNTEFTLPIVITTTD